MQMTSLSQMKNKRRVLYVPEEENLAACLHRAAISLTSKAATSRRSGACHYVFELDWLTNPSIIKRTQSARANRVLQNESLIDPDLNCM